MAPHGHREERERVPSRGEHGRDGGLLGAAPLQLSRHPIASSVCLGARRDLCLSCGAPAPPDPGAVSTGECRLPRRAGPLTSRWCCERPPPELRGPDGPHRARLSPAALRPPSPGRAAALATAAAAGGGGQVRHVTWPRSSPLLVRGSSGPAREPAVGEGGCPGRVDAP